MLFLNLFVDIYTSFFKVQSKLIEIVDFRYEVNYKNWTNAQYENDTNQHFF